MMWFGGGMMVLFWAVVLFGIVALIRYAGWGGQRGVDSAAVNPPEPSAPERLLAERFARGEIDEDEYRQRLAALQAAGHTLASADGQARPPAGTGTR